MKHKLLWLAAVLTAGAAWLFENNAGTLTVFACAVLLPVFGMASLLGKPRLSARWELPSMAEKGAAVTGTLVVKNETARYLPRLLLEVQCENLRTGEKEARQIPLSLLPRQEKRLDFSLSSPHCGKTQTRIVRAGVQDLFGLCRKDIALEAAGEVTVVPHLFPVEISLQAHDMAVPDSDTYAAARPGSDPGEIFAIREYIPGDAIRRIHWKLSEKTGKLLTREFGLPVVNEILLLLETGSAVSGEEADAITEVFASICQSLSERGIGHHVGWRDTLTDGLSLQTVSCPDDFPPVLSALLELPPKEGGSVARRFTEEMGHCGYAHVIVVGGQIPEGIGDLYNGNRVSVLLPRRNGMAEGLQPDGTYLLTFEAGSCASGLCALEV